MKKILGVWVVVALILVGGLTIIGVILKNQNGVYYDLEKKLVASAEGYYGQYPDHLPADSLVITSNKLLDTNFLDNLDINEEKCTGYVVVKKNHMFYKYNAYIKCEKYETKKYDATKNIEGSI